MFTLAGDLLNGDTGDVRAVLAGAADAVEKEADDVRLGGLDELLELVTAYDPDMYGYLVTITRALELS
ncbi:MAG: hypothetical protein BRD21_05115 [Halobacteriales archaeon SW_8_66_22]|nr:MAG: hypothetical protein BRD21_05115 [Halobacteriales archaeon SW_8_66_22]